jgi:MFS family permease
MLVAIAWIINSMRFAAVMLYAAAAIGGIGTGSVYGTCVGNALKWFPGRRGLAAGITAAGFGAGAAITIVPIKHMIDGAGYEHAFLFFGICRADRVRHGLGAAGRAPSLSKVAKLKVNQSARGFADGSAAQARVLRHVRDVRAGRRRRC